MKNVVAILPFLPFFLSGCALIDGDDAKEVLDAGACNSLSVAGFEKTVFPVVRQRCAECHGVNQSPLFAVPDPVAAHAQARPRANFLDVTTSVLALKAGDNHCSSGTCNDRQGMLTAIAEWKDKAGDGGDSASCDEQGAAANFAYITYEQQVPSNAPLHDPVGDSNYIQMSWDLGAINEALRGAQVSIDIQRFTERDESNGGSFRMRWPQISAGSAPISFRGIRILVNNTELYTTWATADNIINPGEKARVHFGALVLLQDSDKLPEIRVVFDKLERGEELLACKELAEFETSVLPILNTGGGNSCIGCHGNTNNFASLFLKLNGTNEEMCAKLLQRTDGANAIDSVLMRAPDDFMCDKIDNSFRYTEVEVSAMKQWIQAERPPENPGLGGIDPNATADELFRFQVYARMTNLCNNCHNNNDNSVADGPDWLAGGRTAVMDRLLNDAPSNPANSATPFVDFANPTNSLILLKPTNTAPVAHGGNERFAVGSADYNRFLSWILKYKEENGL